MGRGRTITSPHIVCMINSLQPDSSLSRFCERIVGHYERCLREHGDSHRGVDWPNQTDAEKRYRIMLDVVRPRANGRRPTLLDFGCGAAHLYEYMLRSGYTENVEYSGADFSREFIALCEKKFPAVRYYRVDLLAEPEIVPEYDYIIANGVFTEKCDLPFEEMMAVFRALVSILFRKTRVALAFNVMSTLVDWERDDLFHVSFDLMARTMRECTSRQFTFRQDYGLYEYTVYVYRET
jgi:hypothetical protein